MQKWIMRNKFNPNFLNIGFVVSESCGWRWWCWCSYPVLTDNNGPLRSVSNTYWSFHCLAHKDKSAVTGFLLCGRTAWGQGIFMFSSPNCSKHDEGEKWKSILATGGGSVRESSQRRPPPRRLNTNILSLRQTIKTNGLKRQTWWWMTRGKGL